MCCFNCGEPLDVATAYMVVPYAGEKYGWYCSEECYREHEHGIEPDDDGQGEV
jgi:hypothetical protein